MFPCQAGAEGWAVLAQTHAAHRGSALQKTSGRVFTRPRRVIKKNAARSSSSPRCRCKGSRMSMYSPEAHRMQFFIRQAEVRTWLHEQAHIGMGHKRRLLCGWVSQRNGSCLGRRVFQVGLVSNPQSNSGAPATRIYLGCALRPRAVEHTWERFSRGLAPQTQTVQF